MNNFVRGTLDKLYDYYSYVDSTNVQVPSGSKTTHIEGDAIGCIDSGDSRKIFQGILQA